MLLLFLLATLCAYAAEPAPGVYQARRAELRKALPDGLLVLLGRTAKDADELRTGFYQEPNFYYLTGRMEPGAALLLTPAQEILFLPRKDTEAERWTGPKASPEDRDIRAASGFEQVIPAENLEAELRPLLDKYPRLYGLTGSALLRTLAPGRDITSASTAIARLRMKKSPDEIAAIRRATEVTLDGHRAVWKRVAAGLHEYQLAAIFTSALMDRGCERNAYAPVIGSGPNSVILHYSRNRRRIERGELLLIDAGAECGAYTSDVTRTLPVGGRFSKRQREIYDIVLGAQKAALAAVKPGMTIGKSSPNSLYRVAYDYIERQGLGRYFTHGVSHHVGLEVHDAQEPDRPLEPGMVITVEPGIYIPEENLGVRIEDIVVVTETGAEVLSRALPKEAAEVEKALR